MKKELKPLSAEEYSILREKFKRGTVATFVLYGALLLLFVFWNLSRSTGINWTIFAFQVLPLLALLPSLWTLYYRAFSWLCFVILLYFIMATLAVFNTSVNALDYLFLMLTVTLFCVSMYTSRWAQRVQKTPILES